MNVSLFLGFPLSPVCRQALEEMPHERRRLFIGDDSSYLKETTFEGNRYVGKSVDGLPTLTDLHLLEDHIYSILCKVFPHYPHRNDPLILFALPLFST